jgi:predicted CXXCH cytochrome family protein
MDWNWVMTILLLAAMPTVQTAVPKGRIAVEPGSEACSRCHAGIYASYLKTAMANASGPASAGLITGEFDDKKSGVHYRVAEKDGHVWMSYERSGADAVRGERELLYFIGSGKKGRSYLFSEQGYLFETPINWYSQEQRWEMTPAYTEAREIPMNLPAVSSCLNCHTSGMQPHIGGTKSRFSGTPFLHGGITCQRCHGTGEGHVDGKGAIVNPAKLSADRRDAICMECHFEGTVAITQPGKHLHQFQPGDRLSDYIHYFVRATSNSQTPKALSQFEALSLSQCQRKSAGKMWCGSCHDPHSEPSPSKKVAYYRDKCLDCHGEKFAAKHHAENPDCVHCHMPLLPNQAVAHTQSTDHRILRRPLAEPLPATSGGELKAFPESDAPLATTRDFALAWETLAQRGVEGALPQAESYLRKAVTEWPNDAALLTALGFVEQERGHRQEARGFYERTLKVRPRANTAAANLGILEAQSGNVKRAVQLWQGAFERIPYRSAIGINLAIVFCEAGQADDAKRYLERVLEFNPDSTSAKQLLGHLNENPPKCSP